jgi:glucose/mannose-6-phosphate isomerase
MVSLDNLKAVERCDKSKMIDLIESFPEQCADAKRIAAAFELPKGFKTRYENIICTGLGGSAIGADLVRSYIADEVKTPLVVNRNYTLPAFAGSETLVITSSYSGNTEETLSAYKDAKAKGASVIAITSGGELEKLARLDRVPSLVIPKGFPPRCALGYSFIPVLMLMAKLGVINDRSKAIDEMIVLLKSMRDDLGRKRAERSNLAKRLAKSLYMKFPVIYGGQDHIDSVVTRWRGQIAENSKTLSSSHVFPEMNHNEIVGWEHPKALLKKFIVVCLRDREDHPRTARRMDVTRAILKKNGVKIVEVSSLGKGLLARMFSLIYIGDFTSFYLAVLNGGDPTPVERVTYLKNELAKS